MLNSDLGEFLFCYVIVTNLGGKNGNFRLMFLALPSVKFRKSWQTGYNYFPSRIIRFFTKIYKTSFYEEGKNTNLQITKKLP